MRPRSAPHSDDTREILLVDDNQHGLVARRALLEELGYSVTTATTGEAAFELFQNGKFDLLITDHKMPRMSGSDLIVKVRDLQPATRIIMLSGFVDALGLTEDTTGADVVIAKNAGEVGNLLRAVTRLLSRKIGRKPPAAQSRRGRSRSAGV